MEETPTKDDTNITTPSGVSKPEGGNESPDRSDIIEELEVKQASIETQRRELGDELFYKGFVDISLFWTKRIDIILNTLLFFL